MICLKFVALIRQTWGKIPARLDTLKLPKNGPIRKDESMTTRLIIKQPSALLMLTILLLLMFITSSGLAANYPLEIIQPRAGLNTKNRFYKAYPGLEYNVRAAVIGGAYPFTYELTTYPQGMTIDGNTGEISWQNPTTSGSPYTVTLRVTDKEGTQQTVTWTVTVTTSGFYFLDAVKGKTAAQGGTGTLSNPWKTLGDMYESSSPPVNADKDKNSYAGGFLYFRSGTYAVGTDTFLEDGTHVALRGGNKPLVWLAYPGETPILDVGAGWLEVYAGASNLYVDGFDLTNITNVYRRGWRVESSGDDVTFRRNKHHGLTKVAGSLNQSTIMISAAGPGQNWAFLNNEFYDINGGYALLGYDAKKVLVANNLMHDMGDTRGIGLKVDCDQWFVRANTGYNIGGNSINNAIWIGYSQLSYPFKDIEVSYNNFSGSGALLDVAGESSAHHAGKVYVFRNTLAGDVVFRSLGTGDGPFTVSNNVIVNDSSSADHIDCPNCTDGSAFIKIDNLSGFPTDGIIDASGNLTSVYSSFLGTRGYQLGDNSASPQPISLSPPTGLRIIGVN
jgi:hypothetical protein